MIREPGGGSVLFEVADTQKPVGGLIVHHGTLQGRLRVGETVEAVVDDERRAHTMRNHTGTHLLHRALRNVVGERARQAGSLVTPDYLRFDFPFDRPLTDEEKRAIEDEVRRIIRDDRPVSIAFMSMAEAIAGGADAFFDEKYGETVRTIRVEDYSFELCGGTHCRASGQIGGFAITGERSIGSGQRRIEAVTGAGADALARERFELLERAAELAGARSPEALPDRIAALQDELRETKRRLKEGGTGDPDAGTAGGRGRRRVAGRPRWSRMRPPYESMRRTQGIRSNGEHGPWIGGRGARARRRRAAAVRDRVAGPRGPRHLGGGAGQGRDAQPSTVGAVAARRWPRARAATAMACRRPLRRSAPPSNRGPDGLLAPHLAARRGGGPRRLHGARRRDGVRQGAGLRYRLGRSRDRAWCRAQATGPLAHAVGHRGRHRRGRGQLRRRPPGGRGDGRLPTDPGRHRHRRRAREGLHDDPRAGAQAARPADHRGRAPEAHRQRAARGAARGRARDHLGDRPAPRRRAARPRRGHRRVDRWVLAHQPRRDSRGDT